MAKFQHIVAVRRPPKFEFQNSYHTALSTYWCYIGAVDVLLQTSQKNNFDAPTLVAKFVTKQLYIHEKSRVFKQKSTKTVTGPKQCTTYSNISHSNSNSGHEEITQKSVLILPVYNYLLIISWQLSQLLTLLIKGCTQTTSAKNFFYSFLPIILIKIFN